MDEDNQQQENQTSSEVSLDQLQQDLDNAVNGWKRAQADFENYKRRKEAENKELVEFAREVTVAKLLPTLDSLAQALKHIPGFKEGHPPTEGDPLNGEFAKQYKSWQTGVNGIVIQLDKTLLELGVKKIEAVGKKFDPHFHEALREMESDKDDGMVIEELQTGFELNGKVIRPSQVVISKKSAKGGE